MNEDDNYATTAHHTFQCKVFYILSTNAHLKIRGYYHLLKLPFQHLAMSHAKTATAKRVLAIPTNSTSF